MARLFRQDEYDAKRNEILDYAARLVYTKGYEQMTTRDIVDGLPTSRGALYHYFDSKIALLEALVERMGQLSAKTLLPIVNDPELGAIQKFRRFFEAGATEKFAHKELTVSLMRIWYSNDNAIIRQKMSSGALKWTAPMVLEPIIRQGVAEGVFTVRYPEQVAKIVMGIALSLSDTMIEPMLSPQPDPAKLKESENALDTYFETIERILAAPVGSLHVFESGAFFYDWLIATPPSPASE
jgi:AcrR family transcriptional regulator